MHSKKALPAEHRCKHRDCNDLSPQNLVHFPAVMCYRLKSLKYKSFLEALEISVLFKVSDLFVFRIKFYCLI